MGCFVSTPQLEQDEQMSSSDWDPVAEDLRIQRRFLMERRDDAAKRVTDTQKTIDKMSTVEVHKVILRARLITYLQKAGDAASEYTTFCNENGFSS